MNIHTYRGLEYIVADMPADARWRPGYVNEVYWTQTDGPIAYEAWYSDGYKSQLLGFFQTREETIAAARDALRNGAGGGLTSRYEPNRARPYTSIDQF